MPGGSSCVEEQTLEGDIMELTRLSDDTSGSEPEQRVSIDEKSSSLDEAPSRDVSNIRPRSNSVDENHVDDESGEPPAKKLDIGTRLMQKMGFTEGQGLGKFGQGRLEPVEAFNQRGRRGLGHDNETLREAILQWDPSAEVVSLQEDMLWIATKKGAPTEDEMKHWMVLGPRKESLDDEILFCDISILKQLLKTKTIFDSLDKQEMKRARTRSNPCETIRNSIFQNRAAVKMANLDRACGYMFTHIENADFSEPVFFADICAGPGGFSEYLLWRRKWHAKGFGFTLKDSNDFKLDEFYAGSPETFHPYYGPKGDGNVYDPDNQMAFRRVISEQTKSLGVHFMFADGGFSVEGKENIQEILSKQLYLCQCLVALMCVRAGGHFIIKLFDLFTPFSAGLVYLMYRCFSHICIFKPNTSRPANSERYLICQGKLPEVQDVINYLNLANHLILKQNESRDVMELVPLEILQSDESFYEYLKESNESLARKQVIGLLKIAAYCEDTTLFESRQAQMRKDCLAFWNLPDQSRTRPRDARPEERLQCILGSSIETLFNNQAKTLTPLNMNDTVLNPPCDWYYVPCGYSEEDSNEPTFYFGLGRTKVFRLVKGKWERIVDVELPPDTFVYAEMVTEYRGNHKCIRKTQSLHIIDAWLLGGQDVRFKYLTERNALMKKFCNAIWKPESDGLTRVRAKDLYTLDHDIYIRLNIKYRMSKLGSSLLAHFPKEAAYEKNVHAKDEPYFFIPNTIMFFKSTNLPWSRHLSRNTGHHYFFNHKTSETAYNNRRPDSVAASSSTTFENRLVWYWRKDQSISTEHFRDNVLSKCPYVSPL